MVGYPLITYQNMNTDYFVRDLIDWVRCKKFEEWCKWNEYDIELSWKKCMQWAYDNWYSDWYSEWSSEVSSLESELWRAESEADDLEFERDNLLEWREKAEALIESLWWSIDF